MSELGWIGATVLAYAIGEWAQSRSGGRALVNPIVIAVALLAGMLTASGETIANFQHATSPMTALLAPATVALAVVTFRQLEVVRATAARLLVAAVAGGLVSGLVAVVIVKVIGGSSLAATSVASHGTTMAVSVELARIVEGSAALAAITTLSTGILGAVLGPGLFRAMGIDDQRVIGLALGVGSHALGTARALEIGPVAGAFAAIGLSASAIVTSIFICAAAKLGAFPV